MNALTINRKCPGGKGKVLKNILSKAKEEGYQKVIFKDQSKEGIIHNLQTEILIK